MLIAVGLEIGDGFAALIGLRLGDFRFENLEAQLPRRSTAPVVDTRRPGILMN